MPGRSCRGGIVRLRGSLGCDVVWCGVKWSGSLLGFGSEYDTPIIFQRCFFADWISRCCFLSLFLLLQ